MERIHFIGIGGSGLSAIARLLKEMGFKVSGSDRADTPFVRELQTAGVTINIGHRPENILGADVVVRSSAIPDDNAEVLAARVAGIPVLKRAGFLGRLMEGKIGIAVAGTHGKTTTTAMIAWLLTELGQDPSFIAGGVLNNLHTNAHAGKGETFVIEADEYDHMFLGLKPIIEVVTNVEHDHPDCYPTLHDFQAAFVDFVKLLPVIGTLVACLDDAGSASLLERSRQAGVKTVAYGFSEQMTADNGPCSLANQIKTNTRGGFSFEAIVNRQRSIVNLQVPGRHNVLNALAALSVTNLLGLSLEKAAEALGKFTGTGRRFELRGEANGISIIDDYAHHPTEIRATLTAARSRFPGRRIWVVWQPHTYTRTQVLFDHFTRAFSDADEVIVTEIFASREPAQDYSAAQVVKAMPHPCVHFIPDLASVSDFLVSHLQRGDVLLVLSAGDADRVSTQVLASIQHREVQHV